MKAPIPENEAERLRALARFQVLDTPQEAAFDRITNLAARLFEAPMALVSLVDEKRQWWKSCFGLSGSETDRDVAFCSHAILAPEPFIVEDAQRDPRFSDNPYVTGAPFVRFYAGAPLTSGDGFNVGTLCIIDTRPRHLSPSEVQTLVDLAQMVVDELELRLAYRSRELFRKVCEMSPNLIYLYERVKHERTFLGPHLIEVLGHAPRPSPDEFLPEIVHPEDLPRLYKYLGQLDVLKQGPIELSYRARHADGSWHWFLAREALFALDGEGRVNQVIGIATDITDLKTTERRLEASEDLLAERVRVLEGILDNAGEGIVVADESGRYTVFNPAARRIVGKGPNPGDAMYANQAYELLNPATRLPFPQDQLPLGRALRGEAIDNLELLIRSADKIESLIRVTGRPLSDQEGNPRGGLITFNDITALRAAEHELAQRATTDQLTGLPNRRAFDERLALLVAEGGRGRTFALVLGDVDHFKKVNDTYGHGVGDDVLAHVARTLQSSVRCTDFVGRYGGEEFCVLYTDVDETQAERLADQLRCTIANANGPVPITCSFGVCSNRPHEYIEPGVLVQIADRALYTAKRQGRNRVVSERSALTSVLTPLVQARSASPRAR
ncbi:MAG TPA: diguanylate cyclase [Polyangiaceae bacterium]|nr:diguanylate cyclase [Polyangiaceae bacterium]